MKTAPFVGRTAELARLQAELAAVHAGARLVLLTGEAGVGKTRLLAEFQTLARVRARCLIGRGSPLGTAIPFSLVVEALESHLRDLGPAQVAALCGPRLAALRGVLPSVAAALHAQMDETPSRLATFEAFICLLESIAKDRPLALVLDDAHRADPSTWELLHYLARNTPRAPLLVVAAVRDGSDRGADVDATIALLLKDGLATELRLEPLARDDLDALVTRTVGPDAARSTRAGAEAALADWLFERTNGNALFATALLEDLGADRDRRDVPRSIRAHVETLTAGLDPTAREVLANAAALGHSFSLATIARLIPADATLSLDELVRRGVLHERTRDGDSTYDFGHPLVQEVTYESLGAARRREMHERLARLLVNEPIAVRAYHAARGALPGDAAAIALIWEAAHEAERAQAHGEALQHLAALRRLIPAGAERNTVLDEVGWQAAEGGAHEVGIEALRELLPSVTEPRERGVVRMRLASLLSVVPGDLATAESEVNEALRAFTEAGADDRLASALNELAWIRGERGDLDAQIAGSREALARAEALGDQTLVLHALGSIGYASASRGDTAAIDALRRSRAIAIERGDRGQTAWHTGSLGLALLCAGRLDEATRLLDTHLAEGPSPSALPYVKRALLNWWLGRWEQVRADQRAVQALHPGSLPAFAAWSASLAGLVEVAIGRDAAGERHLEQGGRFYALSDFYWAGALHDWALGNAHAIAGDARAAQECLARAADRLSKMRALPIEAFVLPDLVEVRVDLGDLSGARAASERVRSVAVSLATAFASAYASYAEGLVQQAEGKTAAARTSLQTAADLASSSGLRPLEARALEHLARTYEGSERVKRATDAAKIYAAIGAKRQEERVLAELRGLGAAGRRSAQAVGDLTPREREIVALVRSGLANKEIAERLSVSERTVETHLAHVYSKLGVEGRRALVGS
jgi:DNA-binding CsgD family transcriptional regulator